MKKSYVKLGFSRLAAPHKVDKATVIVGRMTGNAYFSTPAPALPAVQAAADALDAAILALDGTKERTAIKNQAEAVLDSLINSLGGYVQAASEGNDVKILSSGFEVRNDRTPATLLGPVTGLTAMLGSKPGEVIIKWKGIKGSRLNVVVGSNDLAALEADQKSLTWETTKSKIVISDLESGVVYHFRIVVVNAAGVGPQSETISIKVY
jgi:hypothetical protein